MISTLLITVIVEGVIVIGYSIWRGKLAEPLLLTSLSANLVTQSMLWVVLNLNFRYYFITLAIMEILIWTIESLVLYRIPANRLKLTEAMTLSLWMNLASLAVGWFLPV